MGAGTVVRPTGHVYRVERKRGPVWYAKYRLPDGRQVQKRLGPAWTDRGRPATGYFTRRTAEDWLAQTLEQARRGQLPGMVKTGATFSDACDEFLRYIEDDRERKPSTVAGYRSIVNSMLKPAFGDMQLESITTQQIESWLASLTQSSRTKSLALVLLHGVFRRAKKVWALPTNPAAEVEKPPQKRTADIEVFTPEEVLALVRTADSEQDGAIYLTAAFTGLRLGELLALRWRDVDFSGQAVRVRASYSAGALTTPKSAPYRSRPMSRRRSRNWASDLTSHTTTTSSSSATRAASSTAPLCVAVTNARLARPAYDRSGSTICGTPLARG